MPFTPETIFEIYYSKYIVMLSTAKPHIPGTMRLKQQISRHMTIEQDVDAFRFDQWIMYCSKYSRNFRNFYEAGAGVGPHRFDAKHDTLILGGTGATGSVRMLMNTH